MPIKTTTDESLQLNLTPMIDVVFLLVIFFMAATQFADAERAIDLDLPNVPSAGTNASVAIEPSIVSIDAVGAVALDGKPLSLDELTADLRTASADQPDLEVLIHGDAKADFQYIAGALAACRTAGVAELGITVEIASLPPPVRR